MTAELDRYLRFYYPAYLDKHLLADGGIGDQPARYVELIEAIRDTQAIVDRKYHELTKPEET